MRPTSDRLQPSKLTPHADSNSFDRPQLPLRRKSVRRRRSAPAQSSGQPSPLEKEVGLSRPHSQDDGASARYPERADDVSDWIVRKFASARASRPPPYEHHASSSSESSLRTVPGAVRPRGGSDGEQVFELHGTSSFGEQVAAEGADDDETALQVAIEMSLANEGGAARRRSLGGTDLGELEQAIEASRLEGA
ncbi:MAG: hypothetical protein INR71_08595 [Terriglobus roseus]|nr:hypothetical protein [Terriglobus roseus]